MQVPRPLSALSRLQLAKASQHLLDAVSAYAPLAPPMLLDSFFKSICQKLLKASVGQDESSKVLGVAQMAPLADLADALIPHLPAPTSKRWGGRWISVFELDGWGLVGVLGFWGDVCALVGGTLGSSEDQSGNGFHFRFVLMSLVWIPCLAFL
jgi:hypothetical protein